MSVNDQGSSKLTKGHKGSREWFGVSNLYRLAQLEIQRFSDLVEKAKGQETARV